MGKRFLRMIAEAFRRNLREKSPRYGAVRLNSADTSDRRINQEEHNHLSDCPCCGSPIEWVRKGEQLWSHNVQTCRLVNLALTEIGLSPNQPIRVDVYGGLGPLKGYYSPADPYTIHISEDTYSLFPEYTIFHETKHLVDCLTKGWSEEGSPDPWARLLCMKYGFRYPPPHQHFNCLSGYRSTAL